MRQVLERAIAQSAPRRWMGRSHVSRTGVALTCRWSQARAHKLRDSRGDPGLRGDLGKRGQ
jgi:hypothetical protein